MMEVNVPVDAGPAVAIAAGLLIIWTMMIGVIAAAFRYLGQHPDEGH